MRSSLCVAEEMGARVGRSESLQRPLPDDEREGARRLSLRRPLRVLRRGRIQRPKVAAHLFPEGKETGAREGEGVRIGGTLDEGETNPQFGELARKARAGVADGADRRRECHDFRELLRARPRDDARCGVVGVGERGGTSRPMTRNRAFMAAINRGWSTTAHCRT